MLLEILGLVLLRFSTPIERFVGLWILHRFAMRCIGIAIRLWTKSWCCLLFYLLIIDSILGNAKQHIFQQDHRVKWQCVKYEYHRMLLNGA